MPKRNYLIMFCMLFVLFTYAFGADTLRISTPFMSTSHDVICVAGTRGIDENFNDYFDLDKELEQGFSRIAFNEEYAREHFFVDTTETIYLANSKKIIGKAKYSHCEYCELGGCGVLAKTFRSEEKVGGCYDFYMSENALKYFKDDLESYTDSFNFPQKIKTLLENNKVYYKQSISYVENNDTVTFYFITYREDIVTIDGNSKEVSTEYYSYIYKELDDSLQQIYSLRASENEHEVIFEAILLPFFHSGMPIFAIETAKPHTDSSYKSNLVWNNGKYELQGSRIIFE